MQHLDTDRLAALADEAPTEAETAHLASCAACRHERDAFVALLALAQREGGVARLAPDVVAPPRGGGTPLSSWDTLAPALRAEGLIRPAAAAHAAAAHPDAATPARRSIVAIGSTHWRLAA